MGILSIILFHPRFTGSNKDYTITSSRTAACHHHDTCRAAPGPPPPPLTNNAYTPQIFPSANATRPNQFKRIPGQRHHIIRQSESDGSPRAHPSLEPRETASNQDISDPSLLYSIVDFLRQNTVQCTHSQADVPLHDIIVHLILPFHMVEHPLSPTRASWNTKKVEKSHHNVSLSPRVIKTRIRHHRKERPSINQEQMEQISGTKQHQPNEDNMRCGARNKAISMKPIKRTCAAALPFEQIPCLRRTRQLLVERVGLYRVELLYTCAHLCQRLSDRAAAIENSSP